MNTWNKQDWIKDILSKSGTEITEINEVKTEGSRKMVYYTSVPLLMQPEHTTNAQLCTSSDESVRITNLSTSQMHGSPNEPQLYDLTSSSMQQLSNATTSTSAEATTAMSALRNGQQPLQEPQTPQQTHLQQTKPQYKCDQCNIYFGSKSAHTSHLKSHAKSNGTTRSASGNTNTASSTTATTSGGTATASASSADPYQCDVCKKTFAVPARLVRHYRTHTGERPFECEFCHKMFSVKENLQVHRRIHTKERPYKCEVCGRAFEHSGKLHRHMRIHTGERPHRCSVCNKTFIQSGQLVIHMRTHTGEKPYKCPVEGCGKGFTCSKQLKVHSRTHTGEKPYHCDICFRDFGYNHVLKLHRVQHYGSKCYKCTICDETFKSKKEMEAHIKGHANEMPDDEDNDAEASTTDGNKMKMEVDPSSIETSSNEVEIAISTASVRTGMASSMSSALSTSSSASSPPINPNLAVAVAAAAVPHTPLESSCSETNSDGDEVNYYNLYSRFEHSMAGNGYNHQSGVNPALLAAVSIAASASASEEHNERNNVLPHSSVSLPPPPQPISNALLAAVNQQDALLENSFIYEPLAVMRQQGYFTPAPKVEEFRSSINAASEIVKRVEAALAATEPLLTPPRSTPESPDRSSSPESDCNVVIADRDVMSLPLRKRKLYLRDNQDSNADDNSPPASMVRMSSVIQFAKAS